MLQSDAGAAITIDENEEAPVAVSTISIANSGVSPAATDPYIIVGNPAGFAIDAMGALTAQVDYEALSDAQRTNGIMITVLGAGNEAGEIGSIVLTIMVRNTDDEAPVFNAIPTNITVESGTTTLNVDSLAVTATDSADGSLGNDAEISYAFVNDRGVVIAPDSAGLSTFGDFAIDTDSGVCHRRKRPRVFEHARGK